jgi:hypothetical protein
MSTTRYKKIGTPDILSSETGYTKAWYTPLSHFTTLEEPEYSSPALIGEKFRIQADHTYAAGKKSVPCYIRQEDLEASGESIGETGSLKTVWKPKVFFIGDGPNLEEVISNILNESGILHVQDGCGADKYLLQFGCDCKPAKATKRSFVSGQLEASGKKGSEVDFSTTCKFFYEGTLTEYTS